jgi:serine/threonine protein kinase
MELGDALSAGWENNSSTYRPRDLASEYKGAPGKKLQVPECVRIGLALAGALDFLHRQGLTHRDIKPQNVIFVNGQPKLADAGLVAEIRPDEERTYVGTPGYMPPGEMPGTPQADIYALGMLLYVLSTGRTPTHFPELATTLINPSRELNFLPLNDLLLKACDPNPARRFATAGEVLGALQELAVRFKINSRPSL